MKKQESDFGKGFVYNLILFAKHFDSFFTWVKNYEDMRKKYPDSFKENTAISLWFSASSDHLWELEIPKKFKRTKIGKLARDIQASALAYRSLIGTEQLKFQHFLDVMIKLEELGRLIDNELGVKDIKAKWN